MTGGLLQLAAYGAQDIYLTGNPQITYFVAVYRRYSNFAIENVPQYFYGNADFGQKVYCKFDRIGDLVNQVFLRVTLPDISQYNYNDENGNLVEYYWVNGVGLALIKIIEVEIGGSIIDRQFGIWMDIWGELTVPTDKRAGYYEMIGKSDNPVNLNNNGALDLYVPLTFWFCKNIGLSLPLVALQAHEVRINITFRQYSELVISSNGLPLNLNGQPAPQIQQTNLEVDYIFLEDPERDIFAKNNHQYLIEQIQVYATGLTSNGLRPNPIQTYAVTEVPGQPAFERIPDLDQRIYLNFNHPVKELVWVLQNSPVLSIYPYGGNEWFNYSTQSYRNGLSAGKDTITEGQIRFEGQDLFQKKPAMYFRTVVPFQRHTNTPNNFIYVYSFALNPENFQPSGTCNFSRIDSQELHIKISDELIDPIITIFAVNVNILNIAAGMAGVEYVN